MIGNEQLHKIVISNKVTDPAKILTLMDKGIQEALNQKVTKNNDGMDMTICSIDAENKKIYFAGAKNPMVLIQNGELNHIKGDKFEIGSARVIRGKIKRKIFTTKEFDITNDTIFYLFSDGYADQFGGEKGMKFMIKRFKTFLLEIHTEPMEVQKQKLTDTFNNWKGTTAQVDDVLVIGVKF